MRIKLSNLIQFTFAGCKIETDRIAYVMQNNANNVEVADARQFWPRLIADFLENSVQWVMPTRENAANHEIAHEIEVVEDDVPQRISCNYYKPLSLIQSNSMKSNEMIRNYSRIFLSTDITKMNSKIFYLIEYERGPRFMTSKETKKKWSHLIIEYLEPKLIQ